MKGFFGKLLTIDLSTRTHQVEAIDEAVQRRYLGGKGLATYLMLERIPAGVDPLSPENSLIFALGPATDSAVYGSCRHGIFSKSPLTGFYGESYSGGGLAIPMSRAGYDAIIVTGASTEPVWLEISDKEVIFHKAEGLWGKDTYETEAAVRDQLESPIKPGVMVIGPAGENLVRFAVVKNDGWRVAGRTGMGAVFGSKKLKAVAFYGGQRREFADPDGLKAYSRQMLKDLKDHAATQTYKTQGTPVMVGVLNNAGGFPTRYWSEGSYEKWEKINAQSMKERCNAKPKSCRTCFMACGKKVQVQEGRHKGLQLEGPEYETIYSFGGLCDIDQIEEIIYLNDLCDRMGIDTISGGNLASFAIEAVRRGKIDEDIAYGEPEKVAQLLRKIVRREGVGDILAEGIKPAGEALGLADITIHVKGMEPAGYDPRSLKGMGLAYAVSDRGACHLRSTFYKAELSGMIDPKQIDGKAELFIDFEERCALFDCLILCRFYRDFYTWEELSKIIAMTTGVELDKKGLSQLASDVIDSTRCFNLREGLTADDDKLPKRFVKESLKDGRKVTEEEIFTLVQDYYRLRGWDEQGIPMKEAS